MIGILQAQLQPQSGHQEAEKHRAAIAHENLRGLEIPAQKPGGGAQNGGGQRGNQRLAVQISEHGEKNRSHGGDAGAQAVHMIQNAERGGNAYDPNYRESDVQKIAAAPAQQHAENLRANSAGQQYGGCQRHAHKQFNLVMEQAAVVEDADSRDERGSNEDAHDLGARRSVEGKERGDYHGGVHRQTTKKRDRGQMNFARTGKINHSHAKRQGAYGNNQHE